MAQHRVRALRTTRVAAEDEPKYVGIGKRWHVPGKACAVFTCGTERFRALQAQGAVAELGVEADVKEQRPAADDVPSEGVPLDFPYRSELVAAGLNTLSAIRGFPELTEISGIGPSRAKAVQDALDALDETDSE